MEKFNERKSFDIIRYSNFLFLNEVREGFPKGTYHILPGVSRDIITFYYEFPIRLIIFYQEFLRGLITF